MFCCIFSIKSSQVFFFDKHLTVINRRALQLLSAVPSSICFFFNDVKFTTCNVLKYSLSIFRYRFSRVGFLSSAIDRSFSNLGWDRIKIEKNNLPYDFKADGGLLSIFYGNCFGQVRFSAELLVSYRIC